MFRQTEQAFSEPSSKKLGSTSKDSPVSFYDVPPLFDVTIEEFETSALDRLRILAEIESCAARNRTLDEIKQTVTGLCNKYMPLKPDNPAEYSQQKNRDVLSHFVLRLAFCRSEDLQRRFVKAETTLFKTRYDNQLQKEREAFLRSRDFNWVQLDSEEQAAIQEELDAAYRASKLESTERYYKVRWTRVPDLVEKRRVYLKMGWAYLPGRDLSSAIFQAYEDHLYKSLELTARMLPKLDEDTRIIPLLNNLSQGFLAGISSDWSSSSTAASGDEIKAEMVDGLAKKHFPLCMRMHHENLQKDNHLKYFGRLEYGLFLKILGLSIEESIAFWRRSFSRITDDKFNKEYKYNIRHTYGLEGKRANYSAKSCIQLLAPGQSSDHGCPYKNFDPENLKVSLMNMYGPVGLRASDLQDVMSTLKGGHYHVACTRVFEITHGIQKGAGVGDGESITHPNQYAAKSIELEKNSQDSMAVD